MSHLTDEELKRINSTPWPRVREVATPGMIVAMAAELRDLRALLATPCDTEVRWHNNGRGPRIVFEVGSDDYVVTADRAVSLGAALLRAGLEATNDSALSKLLEANRED